MPVIADWKTQIKVARAALKGTQDLSIDEQVAYYKGELERKFKGYEADGLMLVGDILDEKYLRDHAKQDMSGIPPRTDTTDAEKEAANTIFNRVSGEWTATHERVEEFISQAQYTKQTEDDVL